MHLPTKKPTNKEYDDFTLLLNNQSLVSDTNSDTKPHCWTTYVHYPESHVKDTNSRLKESSGLVEALGYTVSGSNTLFLKKLRSSTLIGEGQLEELKIELQRTGSKFIFLDSFLSGLQQRNLEKALEVKVYDRPGLIIEIFANRAKTASGRLQVSLAALNYEKTRLVRMWTHLERQRGSLGFIGGPGESQLEMDKRMLNAKIQRLELKLEKLNNTRKLQKKSRDRSETPTIALIGYTNAGKSTLFNSLTHSDIFTKDLLFATLDTTRRKFKLPSGRTAILSDTVGFISDLPPQLIAAFQSTLEETLDADIILHIQDITSPQVKEHELEVLELVQNILIESDSYKPEKIIPVFNKADTLSRESREALISANPDSKFTSALTHEGINELLQLIDDLLSKSHKSYCVTLKMHQGAAISWLKRHSKIISEEYNADEARLVVRLAPSRFYCFQEKFQAKNTS